MDDAKRRSHPTPLFTFELKGELLMAKNPFFVVEQFNQLLKIPGLGLRRLRVHVDLAGLTAIDAGALLMLCSRIMLLGESPLVPKVSVRLPIDERAKKSLQDAGIMGFLGERHRETLRAASDRNIQVIDGFIDRDRAIKTEVAAGIRDFLSTKDIELNREDKQTLYLAAQECIENVGLHAYEELRKRSRRIDPPKVWVVAGMFDDEAKVASVGIIDLGVGVVASVRRKPSFLAIFKDPFSRAPRIIEAATTGLRTESGERKHGKGLSTLRAFVLRGQNRRLRVLSSGGTVVCSHSGTTRDELPDFFGTLVLLEVGAVGTSF